MEPRGGIRSATVVDVNPYAGALEHRREVHQLIVDDLDVGDHVQRRQVGQQPSGVA